MRPHCWGGARPYGVSKENDAVAFGAGLDGSSAIHACDAVFAIVTVALFRAL